MTNSVARRICLQHARLVEVTSNIWGTKFKFHGLADSVPANLGQVTYRTSLLHLQPRQMTLVMTELRDDVPAGIFPRSRTKKEKMQPLQFEARAQKGNFPANLVPRIAQRRRENKISFEDKLHYGQTQVVTVAGQKVGRPRNSIDSLAPQVRILPSIPISSPRTRRNRSRNFKPRRGRRPKLSRLP